MVEITLSIVLQIVQTVALIVGIAYYLFIMRNSQRNQELARKAQEQALETRQAQLFMQIYQDMCTPEWWRTLEEATSNDWSDYDKIEEKFMKDTDLFSRGQALFAFFEGLGVMVNRKLIDPHLVDDLLSGPIMRYWEATSSYFVERRIRRNHPPIAEWIEYLYNQIQPIYEDQHQELKP